MNDQNPLTQAIIAGKRKDVPELVNQCLARATLSTSGRAKSKFLCAAFGL